MTVPHTSGTITLVKGSAVVNGTDTAWATALIVGGTLYVNVPNVGAMALPILTVDSNTKITAAIPWNGANGTYTYALVRDGAFERQSVENAVKLSALLNEMRSAAVTALSGLTPAADKLPYFGANGAGALADFNAAARALLAGTGVLPNAQLPGRIRPISLGSADLNTTLENGFVAVVSPSTANAPAGANVGICLTSLYTDNTGASQTYMELLTDRVWYRRRAASSWSSWSLIGLKVIGTVSQSAGVPTGAIIERGSNANGEYVRFADGTQICWRQYDTSALSVSTASGSIFTSALQIWNLPVAFSANPSVTAVSTIQASIPTGVGISSANTGGVSFLVWSPISLSAPNITSVRLTAIGRWY